MEERRSSEEIRTIEAAIARLCTDMEWVKSTLTRMEDRVGCEDCAVSKELDRAISERKEAVEAIRKDLDDHIKESKWTLDRILVVVGMAAVVIWESVKAIATSVAASGKPHP